MDYPVSYCGPVYRYSSDVGEQKFQKGWLFDTDDLKSGSIALNVEATYIPRTDRPKSIAIADAEALDSASEEIERQSARIQREMAREKRARSVSPRRGVVSFAPSPCPSPTPNPLPPRSARGAPSTPRYSQSQSVVSAPAQYPSDPLNVTSLGYHIENADKLILGQELKTLRGALFTTKLQIRDAEKDAKIVREKADQARSDLMLIDYKRETANKDLQRLLDDIERKKGMSCTYDTEIEAKRSELRGFESLGITKDEAKILYDENVGLRQRQRGLEAVQLERDELCRQLSNAKDEVLREQKQGRLQREEMAEEIETLNARLEETQKGWSLAQQQAQALEVAFRRMERDKNEHLQEHATECHVSSHQAHHESLGDRQLLSPLVDALSTNSLPHEQTKEYQAFKMLARQESQENRQMLSRQVEALNKELQQLQVKVTELQQEAQAKEEHNRQLRDQVTTLTSEVAEEQAARAAVSEEHRKTLHTLRKETDSAMLQLRESLFLDKQRALEELRAEIEQDRKNSSFKKDERMATMLAENTELLAEKNQEITRLQERLKTMQEDKISQERRLQEKHDLQVREAVARERAAMEKEAEWKIRNERENLARDTKQRVNEIQMTLDHERETSQRLNREMAQLKEELEEQRRLSREVAKEKLVAVARAKDQVREQSIAELQDARDKVRQEMQLEVDRLQSQLKGTEEEVRALKAENSRLQGRDRDNLSTLDLTEKTVINEINEECRRSASVLGVSPRQVQFSKVSDSTTSRSQINTALANLRAVNEELRKHIQELSSELDSCRAMITTMEKEKEESLENIRLEMEKKRTLELEKIKEKLIRLEVDALDLSRTEAQFPTYRPSPNTSFRLDLSTSRDSCEDISNEHAQELAKVAEVSARQSAASSIVSALRRKDQECAELRQKLALCKDQAAEKYARLFKTEMAQELEKSQALLRHSSLEQKRINDAQQREIARLEKEVFNLALTKSGSTLTPSTDDKLRKLQEEGLRVGDKDVLLAEERSRLQQQQQQQQQQSTKNVVDTGKLQSPLSDHNQELLRLEHVYTQLHRQYHPSSSSSLSVSELLNSSR